MTAMDGLRMNEGEGGGHARVQQDVFAEIIGARLLRRGRGCFAGRDEAVTI